MSILLRAAAGASLFAAVLTAAAVEETRAIEKTLAFDSKDGSKVLEVDVFEGAIRVTGYDGAEARIIVREFVEADSPEKLEEAKNAVQLDFESAEGVARCYVDGPFRSKKGSSNFGGWQKLGYKVRHDFEIQAPRQAALRLKTVNGKSIVVEKMDGDFEIDNINGEIRLAEVSGSGKANSLNGRVAVDFAKNPAKACKFSSLNGSVSGSFKPGLSANLRLKSLNGKVRADFPSERLIPEGDDDNKKNFVFKQGGTKTLRVGNGGPQLQFETLNGSVVVAQKD